MGAKWDISNKQRIGFSEVQLVQKMIDGVSKVIEIEEKLAAGATADEIKASLGGGNNSTAAAAPAAGGKLGKHATEDFGGKALGDPKDSDDFAYLTYETLPKFGAGHKSRMAKTLTQELFDKLKDKKSNLGYTLSNAIQTGVETLHVGDGCCAGDEDSFTVFKELYNPVIAGWHGGYDPGTMTDSTGLNDQSRRQHSTSMWPPLAPVQHATFMPGCGGRDRLAGLTHKNIEDFPKVWTMAWPDMDHGLGWSCSPPASCSGGQRLKIICMAANT